VAGGVVYARRLPRWARSHWKCFPAPRSATSNMAKSRVPHGAQMCRSSQLTRLAVARVTLGLQCGRAGCGGGLGANLFGGATRAEAARPLIRSGERRPLRAPARTHRRSRREKRTAPEGWGPPGAVRAVMTAGEARRLRPTTSRSRARAPRQIFTRATTSECPRNGPGGASARVIRSRP
jgi:hypothetical protein